MVDVFGGWWAVALVVLVGFLPSEVWRVAAGVMARWVDDGSELFVWVKMVAAALVAAVVTQMMLQPPPALQMVPLWGRLLALGLGLGMYFVARRRLAPGVATGLLAMLALAWAHA